MSGYDGLARQLRASVRELRAAGDGASGEPSPSLAPKPGSPALPHDPARRGGHRRPPLRGRRRGLLVALVALVVGGGVATAAQTGVLAGRSHADHPLSAREVASRAMREAQALPACRRIPEGRGATVELATISPVARPLLGAAPDAVAEAEVLRYNNGGPVVAGTARRIVFGDGSVVLLWVAIGNGFGTPADPVACGRARLAQLAKDLPDPGSRLRQKAAVVLMSYRDTLPNLQTLWVFRRHGRAGAGSGAGIPLDGRALPIGVVAVSRGEYTGLAAPGAVRVTADGRDLHRTFEVRDRVFVVRLPAHTGPVKLRQRAADGRVLRAQTVRG
jgi:hypothetical protein